MYTLLRAGFATALLSMLGCLNPSLAPITAQVSCDSADDCSPQMVCAEVVGLCLESEPEIPEIASASVTPSAIAQGGSFCVEVDANYEMLDARVYYEQTGQGLGRFDRRRQNGDLVTYEFCDDAPTALDEGTATFNITLVGELGITVQESGLVSLVTDYTAPSVENLVIPTQAAAGGRVDLSFTINEPVFGVPVVIYEADTSTDSPLDATFGGEDMSIFMFNFTMPDVGTGELIVNVSMVDTVGNLNNARLGTITHP